MENTFKSSVFGGFNRDDVIRYIEKTSLESKQQIEALEQESDGLCRENAELRDKLAAAECERDKLAESYSTASSAQDALKKGLTAAQETISELRAQIEEGAQKLASAKADCDRQLKAKEEAAEQRIAELEAQHAERLSAAEQERMRLLDERLADFLAGPEEPEACVLARSVGATIVEIDDSLGFERDEKFDGDKLTRSLR